MNVITKVSKLACFFNTEKRYDYVCIGDKKQTREVVNVINKLDNRSIFSFTYREYFGNKEHISNTSSIFIIFLNGSGHLVNRDYLRGITKVLTVSPLVIFIEFETSNTLSFLESRVNRLSPKYISLHSLLEKQCLMKGLVSASGKRNNSRIYLAGKFANYKKNDSKLKILAIICLYNEADIIAQNVEYLVKQNIDVHIIDNWSNDGSYEIVKHLMAGSKNIILERYPVRGRSKYYEWKKLLRRVENVSLDSGYDWVIHYDSDEIRESPWPGVNLYDGITFVNSLGFNAIDFTVLNYRFTKSTNDFSEKNDPRTYFKYCEFGDHPGHFIQIKAWKNTDNPVELKSSGGHDASFKGRRVYPIKFLINHYPLRSKKQANKKIFLDRLPRFSPEELKIGFHSHYNEYKQRKIIKFDEGQLIDGLSKDFKYRYFVELISGIGLRTKAHAFYNEGAEISVKALESELNKCKNVLANIESAKVFRVWQKYCHFRDSFLDFIKGKN